MISICERTKQYKASSKSAGKIYSMLNQAARSLQRFTVKSSYN